MKVESNTPKASETAIGIRNWACTLRSSMSGVRPAKVVSDVRRMGRKRATLASITAVFRSRPARRSRFTKSTRIRLAFTTTPDSAMMPRIDIIERLRPVSRWPPTAPINPNGITPITRSGWVYERSGTASSA